MRRRVVSVSAACLALAALLAGGVGCSTTPVRVVKEGNPVTGAEVFIAGVLQGRTGADGTLAISRPPPGATIVARELIFERPGYRGNHGPENGGRSWTERVYLTSVDVSDEGALTTNSVMDPAAEQLLSIRPENTLIGLHFLASLDWDASQGELDAMAERMRQASDYMYNATDGQVYFEQVDLIDDGVSLGDAEFDWNADTDQWPHTNGLAGLFGRNWFGLQNTAFMSRRGDGLDTFQVIDHEFSHLAYGLQDEYQGVWVPASSNFCASQFNISSDPIFGAGGPKASCLMTDEWRATKYCSGHALNPHRPLTWQPGPCWDTLVAALADPAGGPRPRWTIKTPTTRNAIPGRLPSISGLWEPRVNVTNNRLPNLCAPFPWGLVYTNNGQPAAGVRVVLELAGSGAQVNLGSTDMSGRITIVGAHVGDRLLHNGSTTIPSCPLTE